MPYSRYGRRSSRYGRVVRNRATARAFAAGARKAERRRGRRRY